MATLAAWGTVDGLAHAATPAASARAARQGALPLADCRLPHPNGLGSVAARCGTLEVPENPAEPQGRRIALRVAVAPALSPGAGREPLFVLAGGPGQAATDLYAAFAAAFEPVRRTRDIVLVDQRGTGGSNRLACDFPDDLELVTPTPEELRRLSADCLSRLAARPEFYTTSVAVRDLDAVRAALGHARVDLYGVSYGTRVAQHYARRFPDRVRAIVLDGTVPAGLVLGPAMGEDAQRALDLAFARCAEDDTCAQAFPDLASRFGALLARLRAAPQRVELPDPVTAEPRTLQFGAEQLVGAVRLMSYTPASVALLPLVLDRAAAGDLRPLAGQFLAFGESLSQTLAYGMHNAVVCTEDVPFFGALDREALERGSYFGAAQVEGLRAICSVWPRGVLDADLHAPLESRAAALLLSGEADPATPPEYGERAARGFADARHVVVRGHGHGQLATGCTPRLIARFLEAGTARELDASCLERLGPTPFFVDAQGPSP